MNTTADQAYDYYAIKYNPLNISMKILNVKKEWYQHRKTICKLTPSGLTTELIGYEGYDLEIGQKYEFKLVNTNVNKYFVELGTGESFTT